MQQNKDADLILEDELLDSVAGGREQITVTASTPKCAQCGSTETETFTETVIQHINGHMITKVVTRIKCKNCGYTM